MDNRTENKLLRRYGLRRCRDCGKVKQLETEFHKGGVSTTGLQQYRPSCIECCAKSKKQNNSPCWTCDDLEECKALLNVLVDVGDHYEPAPLPCYEQKEKECYTVT